MTEVNIALASRNFQNGGDINPNMDFWRQLEIILMENTIETEPCNIGRPMKSCTGPQIVESQMEKVPKYPRKCLPGAKNPKTQT